MATQWLATDFGGPEVLQQVTVDLAPPGPGEVTIEVRAAGMNPADYKHFAPGQDRSLLPLAIGYEVAGGWPRAAARPVTKLSPSRSLLSRPARPHRRDRQRHDHRARDIAGTPAHQPRDTRLQHDQRR